MDVTYAIVKVYFTESNDVIKRHNNVITIWRTSEIEVTALLKDLHVRSEMKGVQEKENIMGEGLCDHCLASLGKPRVARQ